MSNSAFLLAGTDAALDAWWDQGDESGARELAASGRGTPLLWAALFEPRDIRLPSAEGDTDEVVKYVLRTDPPLAAERILQRHHAVARLMPVRADLSDWAELMASGLRRITAARVEVDITELVSLCGPEEYLPGLESFLRYLTHPRRYGPIWTALMPNRKREFQRARDFVHYACNFAEATSIPTVEDFRRDPRQHGRVSADLMGDFSFFALEGTV